MNARMTGHLKPEMKHVLDCETPSWLTVPEQLLFYPFAPHQLTTRPHTTRLGTLLPPCFAPLFSRDSVLGPKVDIVQLTTLTSINAGISPAVARKLACSHHPLRKHIRHYWTTMGTSNSVQKAESFLLHLFDVASMLHSFMRPFVHTYPHREPRRHPSCLSRTTLLNS
jgi:hypothetical protein